MMFSQHERRTLREILSKIPNPSMHLLLINSSSIPLIVIDSRSVWLDVYSVKLMCERKEEGGFQTTATTTKMFFRDDASTNTTPFNSVTVHTTLLLRTYKII